MFKINLKIISLFFIFAYFISTVLFYNFYKDLVIQDAEQEVKAILDTTNALRNYVENVQKPVIYQLKKEGKLYDEYFDPKVLSASYIARNIHEIHARSQVKKEEIPYRYKLAATNPRNPKNRADTFEAKILNRFRAGEIQEYSTILKEKGEEYFFTAIPVDKNKRSCMRCHSVPEAAPKELVKLYGTTAGFHEKVGDIRAMISLKIPLSHIIDTHISKFFLSSFIALLLFSILYLFIYVIYKKDIKLQKEREKLIANQNKLASMGEMIGNIAHQWRQPLTQLSSILINVELHQERGKLTTEKLHQKITEANGQIAYMSTTIDDFRNFFSSNNEKSYYQITESIKLVKLLMGSTLEKENIELITEVKDDFTLYGHPSEMTQAIVNIINNAKDVLIERAIQQPSIYIKVMRDKHTNIISIKDNAGGINIDPIEKIFEPYFSTKHASIGTGIGLYMTKTIIEKNNNGTISVQNQEQGACFIITLYDDK